MISKLIEYDDPEYQNRFERYIETEEWKQSKKMPRLLPHEIVAAKHAEPELSMLHNLKTKPLTCYR